MEKKTQEESETLAEVKKEMAKPPVVRSALESPASPDVENGKDKFSPVGD